MYVDEEMATAVSRLPIWKRRSKRSVGCKRDIGKKRASRSSIERTYFLPLGCVFLSDFGSSFCQRSLKRGMRWSLKNLYSQVVYTQTHRRDCSDFERSVFCFSRWLSFVSDSPCYTIPMLALAAPRCGRDYTHVQITTLE